MKKTLRQTLTHNYSNTKKGYRTIGGKRYYFKSAWEGNIARMFESLKQSGEIADWLYEDKIFWFERIRRGVRSYVPDFRVTYPDGVEIFWEVKGYFDSKSKTKMKRMRIYHPDVNVQMIDGKVYKTIREVYKPLLGSEWEE